MTKHAEPEVLHLKGALKTPEAASLLAELKARQGEPLNVDAAGVTFVGGACLQALISAAETWRAADQPFEVINPSEAWKADIATLGAGALLSGSAEAQI